MIKCKLCKKREATDIHHKDENHKNNEKNNLQKICALCHAKIHGTNPKKSELKRLVIFRDRAIKIKISFNNQIRNLSRIEYIIPEFLEEKTKEIEKYINGLNKLIKKEVEKDKFIWIWLKEIRGINYKMASKLISNIDIDNTPTVSALWRYCGLDATHIKRRKRITETESKKFGKPYLKKELLGVLADQFIKQRTPKYRGIYDTEKEKQLKAELTRGHAHNRAKRKMIKEFVKDLFVEWKKLGRPQEG